MLKKLKKFFISICIICILCVNVPVKSYGFDGGILLNPITNLLIAIGDAVINLMQEYFIGGYDFDNDIDIDSLPDGYDSSYFDINTNQEYFDIGGKAIVYSASNEVTVNIKYGPASIFSGKINLFNINLLYNGNDSSKADKTTNSIYIFKEEEGYYDFVLNKCRIVDDSTSTQDTTDKLGLIKKEDFRAALAEMGFNFNNCEVSSFPVSDLQGFSSKAEYLASRSWEELIYDDKIDFKENNSYYFSNYYDGDNGEVFSEQNKVNVAMTYCTVETYMWTYNSNFYKINVIIVQDADEQFEGEQAYINDYDYYIYYDVYKTGAELVEIEGTSESKESSHAFYDVLIKMYYIIRNIALVLFMSVLIYVGIKIVLTSTSSKDKAKYKVMLKDWAIGLLLLFVLHFIMIGIATISTKFVDIFSNMVLGDDNTDVLFCTIRKTVNDYSGVKRIGYTLMYLVMIIYTIMFTIQYIKRLLHVIFLTLVAPFVALMYPIDKMKDGTAQSFNKWLKEYMYNVLIQVFHIILYYVLISTAIDLAKSNILYGIVAIGFMLEAEKILKKMFGLDAQGGIFGGKPPSALGGAMVMTAVGSLGRALGRMGNPPKQGENGNKEEEGNIRTADSGKTLNSLLGGGELLDSPVIREDNNNTQETSHEILNSGNGNDESENFEQNENGNYYDPLTGGYDKNYDPHFDQYYNKSQNSSTTNNQNGNDRFVNPIGNSSRTRQQPAQTANVIEQQADLTTKQRKAKHFKKVRKYLNQDHPVIRGVTKTAGHYTGNLALGAAKVGIKLAGASAIGMVGIAAGLASDDSSNVFKYGAIGAGVGYKLGGKALDIPRGVKNIAGDVKDTYMGYAHPGDNSYKNEKLDKEWLNDKTNTRMYANKLNVSMKEAKKIKDIYVKQYRKYGITDDKVIIKAMQLSTNKYGKNLASNDRILVAKFATTTQSSKELKKLSESLDKRATNENDKIRFNNIVNAVRNINDMV
jgi:hypothetical protein